MCAHRVRHGLPRSFPPDALPNWAVRRTTSFRSGRSSPARSAPTAETQDRIEKGIAAIASGIAGGFGATAATNYRRGYPATVNPAREAALAGEIRSEEHTPELQSPMRLSVAGFRLKKNKHK